MFEIIIATALFSLLCYIYYNEKALKKGKMPFASKVELNHPNKLHKKRDIR